MFSKGLPLLFDVLCACCELVVDDATCCACVGSGVGAAVTLGDAAAEDGESVAFASNVEVTIFPVLQVFGPMTIGMIISSVFPSLSVVVCVCVVVTVLFMSSTALVVL